MIQEFGIKAKCISTDYKKWGATDDPKDLTVGEEYFVDYVVIHGSYTQVYLAGEHSNKAYNSVNFEFYLDGKEIDIVDTFHSQLGVHKCHGYVK